MAPLSCGETDRSSADGQPEGYDTGAWSVARLRTMLLAASEATNKTIGLVITFGGIGLFVNVIVVIIAIQIRGERQQNQKYRERLPLDR
jgi:hypothetical protein